MKEFFPWCLLLVLGLSALGCSSNKPPPSRFLHQQMPYARYSSLDGSYHALQELKGKTIVLVFWAQWCPHSRSLMQRLDSIAAKYEHDDSVKFLAVSIDALKDEVQLNERIRALKLSHFEHVYSGNALFDETYLAFEGNDIPHLFVINKEGVVVHEAHDLSDLAQFL